MKGGTQIHLGLKVRVKAPYFSAKARFDFVGGGFLRVATCLLLES